MNTPNLLATPLPGPRTREEIVKFQLEAVKLVAGKLKEGMAWGEAREVDIALDSAQKARGIWPKAEFLARLSTGLLFRAIPEFERIEAFRAVA